MSKLRDAVYGRWCREKWQDKVDAAAYDMGRKAAAEAVEAALYRASMGGGWLQEGLEAAAELLVHGEFWDYGGLTVSPATPLPEYLLRDVTQHILDYYCTVHQSSDDVYFSVEEMVDEDCADHLLLTHAADDFALGYWRFMGDDLVGIVGRELPTYINRAWRSGS